MFIREIKRRNKPYEKQFIAHRLVESYRTEKGPRQRVILDLGYLDLPRDQWKLLADTIEAKVSGQQTMLPVDKKIDSLATYYAQKIIKKHLEKQPETKTEQQEKHNFKSVDVNSLQNSQIKTLGAEYVGLKACKQLGLDSLLEELGFTTKQTQVALLSIIGRLVRPGSELKTAEWARHISGIGELIGVDFTHLSHNALYRISDRLLKHKDEIEAYLAKTEKDLFSLPEKIILYDLTNTYFEGTAKHNKKAQRGRSKEKRNDCPLLTLAMVIDEQGFVKTSRILPGNISEPHTLENTLKALDSTYYDSKKEKKETSQTITVVMDAGIATDDNIGLLKSQGYDYIVVSRKKPKLPRSQESMPFTTVKEDHRNKVQAKLYVQDDEAILTCQSKLKARKEQSMRQMFENRLEHDLKLASAALSQKGGVKTYDKVVKRVNRLMEKHKRISQYYHIEVKQQGNFASAITWVKVNQKRAEDRFSGTYYLRTSRTDLSEQEIWSLYTMLTNLEGAFRSLKTELNLRPIFHRKEERADAHIFIAVLAYHLLNVIQKELKKNNIHMQWQYIRERLSSHERVTTSFMTKDRQRLYIRKTSQADAFHKMIYGALNISHSPLKTKRYES